MQTVDDFLGVDMGIVNIATTSDGDNFSGAEIEATRQWHDQRKAVLQRVGTKSAKRRLRKLSGRQSRFQKKTNHEIAKKIVGRAKDTGKGIALEELKHIRKRTTARRQQRAKTIQLDLLSIAHLHRIQGQAVWRACCIPSIPRNTSKGCSRCGHIAKLRTAPPVTSSLVVAAGSLPPPTTMQP